MSVELMTAVETEPSEATSLTAETSDYDPDERVECSEAKDKLESEENKYNPDDRVEINDAKHNTESENEGYGETLKQLEPKTSETDDQDIDNAEEVSGCPIDGHGGYWDGSRGNSTWYPKRDEVPKNPKTNPEGLTWDQILDKYKIEGIPFKNGEPDFSEVSKGTVEIDNFSENRYGKGGNFDQACEKLAEQRGCTKEEIKEWMKENKYTWHERSDCKTMDMVPTEVHGNIRHEGGISEIKNLHSEYTDNKEK